MPSLAEYMLPGAVFARLSAGGKRQALQALCEAVAPAAKLDPRATLDAVLMRERLAGTGVGEGVALPHARIAGLERPIAAFAHLDPPAAFDGPDGRPADLVLLLLTPAERGADHLKSLARASRALRRADVRDRLRAARTPEEILGIFGERPEGEP